MSAYHRSIESDFGWNSNRIRTSALEDEAGRTTKYSFAEWAPDLGTFDSYEATLSAEGNGARLVAIEKEQTDRLPRYDLHRTLTQDQLGPLKNLDKFVTANLKVRTRLVGVSPPVVHP